MDYLSKNKNLAPAIIEGARLLASVKKDQAHYDYLSKKVGAPVRRDASPTAGEETIPGLELKNYVTRTQTEDETHVLVIDHKEYLERIPEPPEPLTPEEIAQAREDKRFVAKLWAGVTAVGIVVGGVVIAVERSRKIPVTTS